MMQLPPMTLLLGADGWYVAWMAGWLAGLWYSSLPPSPACTRIGVM